MKTTLLFVAIAVVALAQMSQAAPGPAPRFNIKAALRRVGHVASDKGRCLMGKGVPQHLLGKAAGCAPTALAGPGPFMVCAGLGTMSEAKNAIDCFRG